MAVKIISIIFLIKMGKKKPPCRSGALVNLSCHSFFVAIFVAINAKTHCLSGFSLVCGEYRIIFCTHNSLKIK